MDALETKLQEIENNLKSFVGRNDKAAAELKSRMLNVEQAATTHDFGGSPGSGASFETKAPTDPSTGLPILSKQHKMAHNLPNYAEDRPRLDFGKFMRGVVTGHWNGAEAEHKSLTSTTAAGVIMPELLAAQWLDLARAQTQCISAGARTVPITQGKAQIPQLTGDIVGAWQQGELAEIAVAAPTIDSVTVTAHTFACYLPAVSVQLFEDSTDLLGTILSNAFARSFAVAMDSAALKGGGGANEPTGLLNNAAVPKTSVATGKITGDEISAGIAKIKLRNFLPNAVIYNPEAESELDTAKASTAGSYLGLPAGVEALDHLVTSSADNDVFIGAFENLIFFPRTEITLETSRVAGDSWKTLAVSLRAYLRCDVIAVQPAAFQVLTSFGS